MSGQLSPEVLYHAYSQGYFPMPDEITGEINWFRPDPRAVFPLEKFHISRSLNKIIRKNIFEITYSKAFKEVIEHCARRKNTWINTDFIKAFERLYDLGQAQSVEVWLNGKLVGGVYGVHFGGAFFAESMFFRVANASKVALYHLVQRLKEKKFFLLECQFMTDHLKSLGAEEISDQLYTAILKDALTKKLSFL